MTVVENGTVSGMRKAAQGEIDMVGVGAPHYLDAVGGTGKYVDDPEALRDGYKGMKAILAMPVGMAQYVARADKGIKSFTDLEGKTVGTGRPGGYAGKVTATLFDIHGIGGKVDGQAIKYGPAMEQMAAGTMDATLVWGSLPTAVIDNASRQMSLRFISPDPSTLENSAARSRTVIIMFIRKSQQPRFKRPTRVVSKQRATPISGLSLPGDGTWRN